MGPTFSQLTSLSFHVNRASNSWVTTFPKFYLENQGSRSWVRSKLKVTTWVQHSVDSHPFRSMWIGHPIPEIRFFQNLTLKIKGQGHGWGHSSKSQCGSNILSAHIPFIPCQTAIPFLSYDFLKIWPWKSRVKVMVGVTVQSQNVGLASYWFTSLSFHVNRPSHSWDTVFSKFDLENQGSRSNDHDVHNYRSRQFHRTSNGTDPSSGFRDMGSAKSGPSAAWFDKFLAHRQAHTGQMGKWLWQCTTTGPDKSMKL